MIKTKKGSVSALMLFRWGIILEMRRKGLSWPNVSKEFNRRFKVKTTANSIRQMSFRIDKEVSRV